MQNVKVTVANDRRQRQMAFSNKELACIFVSISIVQRPRLYSSWDRKEQQYRVMENSRLKYIGTCISTQGTSCGWLLRSAFLTNKCHVSLG